MKKLATVLPMVASAMLVSENAFAAEASGPGVGAGLAIGAAVLGGAFGQGLAARAMLEGTSRNPQASQQMFVPYILGLAFIESICLFAFLIAGGISFG